MSKVVQFFNFNNGCVLKLFNALHSLRKHYNGNIVVKQDRKAKKLKEIIKLFEPFDVQFSFFDLDKSLCKRNLGYTIKPRIMCESRFDYTMFCDSDVIFLRSPNDFFSLIERHGLVLTAFNDWMSSGRVMSKRIKRLEDYVPSEQLAEALNAKTAINTGVLGFNRSSNVRDFFNDWIDLTEKAKCQFIIDEIACQLVYFKHSCYVTDASWNCSVKYGKIDQAKILHLHGRKNNHIQFKGARIWWSLLIDAMKKDLISKNEILFWGKFDKRTKEFMEDNRFEENTFLWQENAKKA